MRNDGAEAGQGGRARAERGGNALACLSEKLFELVMAAMTGEEPEAVGGPIFRRKRTRRPVRPPFYDMEFDAVLIECEHCQAVRHFAWRHAGRAAPGSEWAKLVSGLMDDTPLGCGVTRSETGPK